jgi:hypothetical protein
MNSLGMHEPATLMHPDAGDPGDRGISSGFPADLLRQSAGRLRVLALLYAFVFFMAGIFPALLIPGRSPGVPGFLVKMGLTVEAATRSICATEGMIPRLAAGMGETREPYWLADSEPAYFAIGFEG